MTRFIRVAAVQLRAHDRRDFARSLNGTIDAVRQASETADLVVLPEGTFPAYVLGNARLDEAAIEAALQRLRDVAKATRTVVVAGAAVPDASVIRNSAIVIDADGSLAGRADKLFLWHFDRLWFAPGERLAPVPTSIGRLGVLVCADGRLPTIARTLVDRGAELLVMPTAWVTSGRDPHSLENVQADLLGRVRAYENRVPFVAANKCGAELGMVAYCGKSQIVDAHGATLAVASEQRPETLAASVELVGERPQRAALGQPAPRSVSVDRPIRIAISFEPLPGDIDERLEMLDDVYALSPGDGERAAILDRAIPVATVDDALVLDPAGLVGYRTAGYPLICWTSDLTDSWTERIARARALELRIFLVVFDRAARRAFAVDPDGAILAGTFGDFRIASFSLDPGKTIETAVAPGTDIREGLERVAELANRT
jgi:predicted amidohydrolase